MKVCGIDEETVGDREGWKENIRIVDPTSVE